MPNRYQDHPTHPLHNVPQEILDAARFVMSEAVECRDISAANADPLADAVVMALLPWLGWSTLWDFGPEHMQRIVQATTEGVQITEIEHTARHGLGMASQDEMITCSCGAVGWVSVV